MSAIVGTIRQIIQQELRAVRTTELGLVETVYPHSGNGDKDNYACDVRLRNSGLLLKRVPISSNHIGTVGIPNVGDLVLLAFVKGDVNQPIVIGRLYNDVDRPPLNKTDEIIFRLPLAKSDDKTIAGAIRNHADGNPPREILIEMAPKIMLRITDGTVRATAGKTEMKLDQPGSGSGTVIANAGGTKITLNEDGDVTVEAVGSMTLKAGGDLQIEANNITVKARAKASISAQTQAELKGGISATVEGSASGVLRGATVSIKGVTSFSPG